MGGVARSKATIGGAKIVQIWGSKVTYMSLFGGVFSHRKRIMLR